MEKYTEVHFLDIIENGEYAEFIEKIVKKCFEVEHLENANLYVGISLTDPANIKRLNGEYRHIESETDVLSFPMFEKEEIEEMRTHKNEYDEALGDIVISVQRVTEQSIEYGHSFERELAYMVVHGFYHLMGEDHMEEDEKARMRAKEENVLKQLDIKRE